MNVSIEYADTCPVVRSYTKKIVAIHGNPGTHQYLSGLIGYFLKKPNVRFISPNLPNFEITSQTMSFWHSNEERVQLIRDFLQAIGVNEIDCLLCHSAVIHPILLLWSEVSALKDKLKTKVQ